MRRILNYFPNIKLVKKSKNCQERRKVTGRSAERAFPQARRQPAPIFWNKVEHGRVASQQETLQGAHLQNG
jgi:hypothetical protein